MPDFDWQTYDNDTEWHSSQESTPTPVAIHEETGGRPVWAMRHWRLLAALLLIFAIGGGWAWRTAQNGVDQITSEIHAGVEADLRTSTQATHNGIETDLHTGMTAGEVVTGLKIRELGEDWALVDVQLQPRADGPLYRQTRIYRFSNGSWVRAGSASEHWGRERQLESRYFVFHYYSVDHEAVTQATARLDELYAALYATFFGDALAGEKLVVVLDPEWVAEKGIAQSSSLGAVVVPSPAAILAPASLPQDELLAQSLMLALFDKLAGDARERYKLSPQWLPLRNGLRLWLIWQQKLPLAVWREPLVQWTLGDSDSSAEQAPAFAHDLCAYHQLWMPSPLEVRVPVQCWPKSGDEEGIMAWRYRNSPLALTLPSLADVQLRSEDGNLNLMKQPPESAASGVAWATVLEYATTRFGGGKVPVLLAALPEQESWETLVPAVFGVPLAQFESGWQTFLKTRYTIVR